VRPFKLSLPSLWLSRAFAAVHGSKFYDHLLARRGTTTAGEPFDVVGLFMVDPLNVVRALESSDYEAGEWTEVQHPIAVVVFGEVGQAP